MTLTDARKMLAQVGMVIRKNEYGEYRVNFRGGAEDTAYYSDELKDAVDTAVDMWSRAYRARLGL